MKNTTFSQLDVHVNNLIYISVIYTRQTVKDLFTKIFPFTIFHMNLLILVNVG